ncbi:unnamed protein product, partial [Urochloa humidicola]
RGVERRGKLLEVRREKKTRPRCRSAAAPEHHDIATKHDAVRDFAVDTASGSRRDEGVPRRRVPGVAAPPPSTMTSTSAS